MKANENEICEGKQPNLIKLAKCIKKGVNFFT